MCHFSILSQFSNRNNLRDFLFKIPISWKSLVSMCSKYLLKFEEFRLLFCEIWLFQKSQHFWKYLYNFLLLYWSSYPYLGFIYLPLVYFLVCLSAGIRREYVWASRQSYLSAGSKYLRIRTTYFEIKYPQVFWFIGYPQAKLWRG